jgi:phospholipid-transporting ATPase
MTQAEYDEWNAKYTQASLAIIDREKLIDDVALLLENNFQLVGSTAIEDKLQDGVGDTIKFMKDAGIKVWVLTGDKVETAINIGYSCKLLDDDLQKFVLNQEKIQALYSEIDNSLADQGSAGNECAVIVTGDALTLMTNYADSKDPDK